MHRTFIFSTMLIAIFLMSGCATQSKPRKYQTNNGRVYFSSQKIPPKIPKTKRLKTPKKEGILEKQLIEHCKARAKWYRRPLFHTSLEMMSEEEFENLKYLVEQILKKCGLTEKDLGDPITDDGAKSLSIYFQ